MTITSTEIHEQSFKVDRKGYNVDEVDVFLEQLANEVDWFNEEIARLTEQVSELTDALAEREAVVEEKPAFSMTDSEKDARIRELEARLDDRKMDDNAIAKALIVAQRSGDDIIARSKADADRIIADANEEAHRILGKANGEKQRILDTITNLTTDREAVRAEYQDLLKGFIASATQKLTEVGGDLDLSSFAQPNATGRVQLDPMEKVSPAVATYTTPQPVDAKVVTPITPKPSKPEKDLSGFGDADDVFEFDDVE